MICPNCGANNSAGRNYCYNCAAPLTEAARRTAGDAPSPTAPPAPPVNPPSRAAEPPPSYSPPPGPPPVTGNEAGMGGQGALPPETWPAPRPAPGYPPPASPPPTYAPPAPAPASSRFPLVLAGLIGLALLLGLAGWSLLGGRSTANPTPAPAAAKPVGATATPRPTAPPPARVRPGEALRVPHAARPPVLDGALAGDWAGEGYPVDYVVYGPENLSGPNDLNGRLWFAWDDQTFYLATLVQDDVFSQPSRGEQLYLGDSVEIQWDVDLQGDFDSNEFNADDWHIGLSPGNFRDTPPEAYVWTPRAMTGTAAGVQVAAQRFTTAEGGQGYTLEAAIPWRLLNVVPAGGQAFGFTFSITDDDLPTPAQQSMLSTSPNREWHKPLTFNTLILQP